MLSKVNLLVVFFAVLSVIVNCELNAQYEIQSSYNETEQAMPEVIEVGNTFEDVTVTADGLMTTQSPPVTEAVTPNITTKPTWIQRIPKKKPKPTGT